MPSAQAHLVSPAAEQGAAESGPVHMGRVVAPLRKVGEKPEVLVKKSMLSRYRKRTQGARRPKKVGVYAAIVLTYI